MRYAAIVIVSVACCIALASYAASVGRFHVEVTNECGTTANVVLLLDKYGRLERTPYRFDPNQTIVLWESHDSREIWFRAKLVNDDVVAWTGKQVQQKDNGFFAYTDKPTFLLFGGRVDFDLCGRAGLGDSVLPVRRERE